MQYEGQSFGRAQGADDHLEGYSDGVSKHRFRLRIAACLGGDDRLGPERGRAVLQYRNVDVAGC